MGSYILLTVSVIMFGVQFLFNEKYQNESGSGAFATFAFSLIGGGVGLVALLLINRFALGFTPFTLLMASVAAINSILYTFFSLKAFEHINLSLYSLFAMLGGMVLPFIFGILFYSEGMSLAKAVCLILITLSLILTVEKGDKKKGYVYYGGVFVLNGMSGVLSKIFMSAPYAKADEASYSIWMYAVTAVVSAIFLIFIRKENKEHLTKKAVAYAFGCGALSKIANYFLLIALAVLPASVQYPFVTGGVMVASAILSALFGAKPCKKEIFSIILSFIGILALVLIPI